MLDVVREIGTRSGRAVAVQIPGSGAEFADTPWEGMFPLDPGLYDVLEAVGIRPGGPEFEAAERAANEAYERMMATEFA
jgi:hypothetical protein